MISNLNLGLGKSLSVDIIIHADDTKLTLDRIHYQIRGVERQDAWCIIRNPRESDTELADRTANCISIKTRNEAVEATAEWERIRYRNTLLSRIILSALMLMDI